MIVSIILIGLLSVAVLALPAFPKTWVTSGIDYYLVLNLQYSFTSELDTSGKVTGMNKIDPSSKGGINSEPRRVYINPPISKAMQFTNKMLFSILNKKNWRIPTFHFSIDWILILWTQFPFSK
jgi:hypothetical protein